ncbi:MAG: hypothetical protein RL756_1099 [Pseudomonadota bacterium]|jgi:hypothetical protein
MDAGFLSNLSSPPLLFFFLGAAAAAVRSDLEIPAPVAKFLSLYLLFAIGFKGGVALSKGDLDGQALSGLGAALVLACLVPLYAFALLKRRLGAADAAALAATYGSISAVTFVTATSYLDSSGVAWGGHLVAAMALMESPAIIIGILLYRLYGHADGATGERINWGELLREACLNGSVFLIVGSMVIGWITGERGMTVLSPFIGDLFIGLLCLFLLDMGIVAARRLRDLRRGQIGVARGTGSAFLLAFAVGLPLANALVALALARLLGLSEGDALLLVVLGASASYIAVPAALRLALPEANPSIYLPLSLAVTFPFNLLVGIPLYHELVRRVVLT